MNTEQIISELEKNKIILKSLLEDLTEDFYLFHERAGKWNLLEVVCHLYDEELYDFRLRVKSVLENPEVKFPPSDTEDWVVSCKYSEQNYNNKLNDFLNERDNTIVWLKQLSDPKWDNVYPHSKRGPLTAKMFFVNWLAHDYLHIRQIIRIKYEYLKNKSGEDLGYAGDW